MLKQKKLISWILILIAILVISVFLSILIGSVNLPVGTTIRILLHNLLGFDLPQTWTTGQEAIVMNLRLPRIFLSIVVGAMLSISGVAFQGVLRNPLADPYILGVSSGAALGAAFTILFLRNSQFVGPFTLPLFAFFGGLISLVLVMLLASFKNRRNNETLILAGVIAQSFTGAILSFLIAISGDQLKSIVFWMMGSLANNDWLDVWVLIPYFLLGMIYLVTQYKDLNVLALGEQAAKHLGIDVEKKKIYILLVASMLATSAVSIVGIIGFVGLVTPHLIRLLTGPDHRILIPISTIAGAIFLLWADTLARSVIPSREIPIGVITAFVGAPFFAYLLRRGLRRGN